MFTAFRSYTVISMRTSWLIAALLALPTSIEAADLRATVRDEQGRPVADAVVVAIPEGALPRGARSRVDQVDLEFVPHVKAIHAGSSVSFPNRDRVRHHVYSFSPAKRFELPLYVGTPAEPVVFNQPGVVTIGCNIHDWMVGYIYVSPSPHFGTTGAEGAALVAGMPAGRYTVRVWHPRLAAAEETTRRQAELGATGSVALEWVVALKPEARVRRAPASGRSGRY
jgi:plastocyanin